MTSATIRIRTPVLEAETVLAKLHNPRLATCLLRPINMLADSVLAHVNDVWVLPVPVGDVVVVILELRLDPHFYSLQNAAKSSSASICAWNHTPSNFFSSTSQ